jgi:hypothetical protein
LNIYITMIYGTMNIKYALYNLNLKRFDFHERILDLKNIIKLYCAHIYIHGSESYLTI